MSEVEQTPSLIVLRKGDHVLITLIEDPEPEDGAAYIEELHKAFPGVHFVLLGGVAGLVVQPGSQAPEDTPE